MRKKFKVIEIFSNGKKYFYNIKEGIGKFTNSISFTSFSSGCFNYLENITDEEAFNNLKNRMIKEQHKKMAEIEYSLKKLKELQFPIDSSSLPRKDHKEIKGKRMLSRNEKSDLNKQINEMKEKMNFL
jgi:hypothetical protein